MCRSSRLYNDASTRRRLLGKDGEDQKPLRFFTRYLTLSVNEIFIKSGALDDEPVTSDHGI